MKQTNILQYLSRLLCLVMMVSLVACGDDDDDDNNDDDEPMADELVNTYEFTSATFTTDVVIVVPNPADGTPAPVPYGPAATSVGGTDATIFLKSTIEGAAECDEGVKIGIDLRAEGAATSGTSFYVCEGGAGTERQQGTWEVNADRSEFKLKVTTLDPPVDIIIPDFTLENGVLSGVANIPLPLDAFDLEALAVNDPLTATSVAVLAAGGVTVAEGDPNIQLVPLEFKFTVVSF